MVFPGDHYPLILRNESYPGDPNETHTGDNDPNESYPAKHDNSNPNESHPMSKILMIPLGLTLVTIILMILTLKIPQYWALPRSPCS